jgi:hypothetical protein
MKAFLFFASVSENRWIGGADGAGSWPSWWPSRPASADGVHPGAAAGVGGPEPGTQPGAFVVVGGAAAGAQPDALGRLCVVARLFAGTAPSYRITRRRGSTKVTFQTQC